MREVSGGEVAHFDQPPINGTNMPRVGGTSLVGMSGPAV